MQATSFPYRFFPKVAGDGESPWDRKVVFKALLTLKKCMVEKGVGKVAISVEGELRMRGLGKMVEWSFTETEVEVWLFIRGKEGAKTRKEGVRKRQESQRGDAIIVKTTSGRTYTELLREVKSAVADPNAIGVVVESTRMTRELLVEVGKGGQVDPMKKAIEEGITNVRVETQECRGVGHGRGISGTARVPRKAAKGIIRKGRMMIGGSRCWVMEWIEVKTCYRCWCQRHVRMDCRGPDRSGSCHRCGEGGHKAKECGNPPKCPLCDKAGHKARSWRCPTYRSMEEGRIGGRVQAIDRL